MTSFYALLNKDVNFGTEDSNTIASVYLQSEMEDEVDLMEQMTQASKSYTDLDDIVLDSDQFVW